MSDWKETPNYDWLEQNIRKMINIQPFNDSDRVGYRGFIFDGSRYIFDNSLLDIGFKQYDTDQDAWYFGTWVHLAEYITVSYAEGDICIIKYRNKDVFKKELQRMADFYGEAPPSFISFAEDKNGNIVQTNHYTERPTIQ